MHLLASVSSKGTGSFDQASLFSYISQFFDCAMFILKKVSSQCPFNLFLLHNHFHLSWLVVIESFILFYVFLFLFLQSRFLTLYFFLLWNKTFHTKVKRLENEHLLFLSDFSSLLDHLLPIIISPLNVISWS